MSSLSVAPWVAAAIRGPPRGPPLLRRLGLRGASWGPCAPMGPLLEQEPQFLMLQQQQERAFGTFSRFTRSPRTPPSAAAPAAAVAAAAASAAAPAAADAAAGAAPAAAAATAAAAAATGVAEGGSRFSRLPPPLPQQQQQQQQLPMGAESPLSLAEVRLSPSTYKP